MILNLYNNFYIYYIYINIIYILYIKHRYNTQWYTAPLYAQKLLLITLRQSMKNSKIIVGGLFVMSLEGLATVTLHIYRVFQIIWDNTHVQIERTKLSQKVLYHFAIFAINELLIIKNCCISPTYRLITST